MKKSKHNYKYNYLFSVSRELGNSLLEEFNKEKYNFKTPNDCIKYCLILGIITTYKEHNKKIPNFIKTLLY
jgi:hypothetical protein